MLIKIYKRAEDAERQSLPQSNGVNEVPQSSAQLWQLRGSAVIAALSAFSASRHPG
jgi:hypothetical protein